jgi:hypothetical protein
VTRHFYVDKSSGTFADSLLAHGLAVVISDVSKRIQPGAAGKVRITDEGAYYRLESDLPIDAECLSRLEAPYVPAVVIRTAKNAASLPVDLPLLAMVEYEQERDRRAEFFELLKGLPADARRALARREDHPALEVLRGQEPHEQWDVFRAINPAALPGYNKLMTQWWAVQVALPAVLSLLCDAFARTPNDMEEAMKAWKELGKQHGWQISPETTALQVYNPCQGKGQNRSKADRLVMDNVKNAFWLAEWLKAVGFYHAALTKLLSGSKDRKTYVAAPTELDLAESDKVMDRFRPSMVRAESAVRSDVLASLRYTQALLDFSKHREGASLKARLLGYRQPSRVVSGLYSAFYKDLGNAVATMNMSFIGLPGWIHVSDDEEVDYALTILAEHEAIIRQLDESHGDAYNLLLHYRNFVGGNDLWPFFEFTAGYSGYVISQRERPGGRARQFSEENLRRLIVNTEPKLSRILETEGFQRIAYAIRQSTVVAQYRKQQNDRRYDVRYGLGQELTRKANYPQDFIAALCDFLHKYNAENAQVMENRPGPYRRSIHTADIDEIVALVDEFGAPLVCNLLVAYGYARTSREAGSEEERNPQEEMSEID